MYDYKIYTHICIYRLNVKQAFWTRPSGCSKLLHLSLYFSPHLGEALGVIYGQTGEDAQCIRCGYAQLLCQVLQESGFQGKAALFQARSVLHSSASTFLSFSTGNWQMWQV